MGGVTEEHGHLSKVDQFKRPWCNDMCGDCIQMTYPTNVVVLISPSSLPFNRTFRYDYIDVMSHKQLHNKTMIWQMWQFMHVSIAHLERHRRRGIVACNIVEVNQNWVWRQDRANEEQGVVCVKNTFCNLLLLRCKSCLFAANCCSLVAITWGKV